MKDYSQIWCNEKYIAFIGTIILMKETLGYSRSSYIKYTEMDTMIKARDNLRTSTLSISTERDRAVQMMQWAIDVMTSLYVVDTTPIRGDMDSENEQVLDVKWK